MEYDEFGNMIKITRYDSDGDIMWQVLCEKIEYITITVKTIPEPVDIIPRFIYG